MSNPPRLATRPDTDFAGREAGAGAGAIGAYIGGPIGDSVGFIPLMGIFGLLFIISTLALFGIKEKTMEVGTVVAEIVSRE